MILKPCLDCSLVKSLEDFPPATRRSDGRGPYCRACMTVRSRASYRKRAAARGRTVKEAVALAEGMRRCPDCQDVLGLDAFPRSRNTRDGRGTYCKPCHNVRSSETRERLYGGGRHYHLTRRYGISAAEADDLVESQGGRCAVCRERDPGHVDHDHLFGHVRGMTCFNCNGGLGQFQDRTDLLRNAIDYLETTTWQRTQVCTGVFRLRSPRPAAAASPTSSELQRLICSRRG